MFVDTVHSDIFHYLHHILTIARFLSYWPVAWQDPPSGCPGCTAQHVFQSLHVQNKKDMFQVLTGEARNGNPATDISNILNV